MNELQTQIGFSLLVPYVLEWLKGQKWFPFVGFDTGKLNAAVSGLIALATGLGIATNFDTAHGVLTISGLTEVGIINGLKHGLLQFLMQHAAYRTLIAPPSGSQQAAIHHIPVGIGGPTSKPGV